MQQITVNSNDFTLLMSEKIKLYNMFGRNYMDKASEIFDKLSNILNSDSLFTELVEKRVNDKAYQTSALDKIKLYLLAKLYDFSDEERNQIQNFKSIDDITNKQILEKISIILNNQEQSAYFDILYSITEQLFNDYVFTFLHLYINDKEPALDHCEGVQDIPQCNFIIERYKQFMNSLNIDATPAQPATDENGNIIIEQGDLFHGTRYSEDVIENIANKGLVSGQLLGIEEDGETFFCVDFFKATSNTTADEICKFGKQYTNGANQVVFVINHSNLEGSDAMFPDLTDYDAYDETTEKGQKAREFVNVAGLPLDHSTASAILIGVPPCMISSIIVNCEIENDLQKIDFLSSHFPKTTIISRSNGEILRSPIQSYKK